MPADSSGRELNPKVAQELQTQSLRIKPPVAATRLWERVLTERERQQLGGSLDACYPRLGTAGMWMRIRGVSLERAVIEVARELGFLDQPTATWLLREVGEELPRSPSASLPAWDRKSGTLRLGKRIIRRVRVMKQPSNIQQILDAFQAAGWPTRVANPLSLGQQQLHESLRSLHRGLKKLRFRSQEGGQAITWERV